MTAPGGNFFSKSQRRAKKAADASLEADMALVDQPSTPVYPKQVSGGTVVHLENPGDKARDVVREAESNVANLHGPLPRRRKRD